MMPRPPAAAPPRPLWPPDDTEESVVGTTRHQYTITNMRWGLNEIAAARTAPGQPRPWYAHSQIMITGLARPDGTRYNVLPDVFVYREAIDPDRGSLSLLVDGPPVLIVEVASESTYDSDLDITAGKGWSYAHAGVREYLVLDPAGLYLRELGRGWRLEGGVYVPWLPDAQGRWQSAEIEVAIAVEDGLATVYTPEGERQLHEGEVQEALQRRDAELAELRKRLERLEGTR